MLSIRDPIHGFIQADELETALLKSRPMQRLRYVHQLGVTYLVYPGAEHSRFNHTVGVMHLAGRIYDALAARSEGLLPEGPTSRERRLVRVAALVHDIGHAPFSHSAEDLFEDDIDHEEMTRRLLDTEEMAGLFEKHGDGVDVESVKRILRKEGSEVEFLLSEIVSSELDVDKMDYLRRDSLYCGVQYGSYDLEQMIQTIVPIRDPENGAWRIGVDQNGVHALEGLVMARYYMFTQVYFNVTSKVMELHFAQWLREQGREWPSDPEAFLLHDDITVLHEMRRSENRHARAIVERERYSLAHETSEHLSRSEREAFQAILPALEERFGSDRLLVDNSAKDPHRMQKNRVYVRPHRGGTPIPMTEASDFIKQLSRIDCFRVYAPKEIRQEVSDAVDELLARSSDE